MNHKIFILFQMGSEVRQFGHSGFMDLLLDKGWQVSVVSHLPADVWRSEINPAVGYIGLPNASPSFWLEQVGAGLDLAHNRRRQKAGLSTWLYGKKKAPARFKQRARQGLQQALGLLFAHPAWFAWGERWEQRLAQAQGQAFAPWLQEHQPDVLVTNVPRFGQQTSFLAAAQAQGIARFLFFHTNKDVVALSRLNHPFTRIGVWNAWMQAQLLAQNPLISPETVSITGCSHFDCVGRTDWLIPEAQFRADLGLQPDEKIVLYTAAGPGAVPGEERFIAHVADAMPDTADTPLRLVVRLNPMDDSSRIADFLQERYPAVVVRRPDWLYDRQRNLNLQKKADAIFFNSLLHYSAVCVNIPSTLTVECALAGLPVINIGFDLPGPTPLPGSIRAFWDVDYYANVRFTQAAILCETPEQIENYLHLCLSNKIVFRDALQKLIQIELHGLPHATAHYAYYELLMDRFLTD